MRRALWFIPAVAILVVLVKVNVDSSIVSAIGDIIGVTFMAYVNNRLKGIDGKTDTVIHQTNSDLDRRMEALNRQLMIDVKAAVDAQEARVINALTTVMNGRDKDVKVSEATPLLLRTSRRKLLRKFHPTTRNE